MGNEESAPPASGILHEEHAALLDVLSQTGLGICRTALQDGLQVVTWCNAPMAAMLGAAPDVLRGRPHPLVHGASPASPWLPALRERLASRKPATLHVRFDAHHAMPGWYELRLAPEPGGHCWILRDVTQEVATRELWKRYAFVVDTSRDLLALIDADGAYSLVNDAFAEAFGGTVQGLCGMAGERLWGEERFAGLVREPLAQCLAHGEARKKAWVELPASGRVFLDMHYRRYAGFDAETAYAVFVGHDITEAQRAYAELAALNLELEERVAARTSELSQALRDLEAFNYTIAHDLRTPLRFLGSFARQLAEEESAGLSRTGEHYCQLIQEGAGEMAHLIEKLLEFARLGRQPLALEAVDLGAAVRDALAGLRPPSGVRIDIGPLPACQGDAALLRQVFVNLLGNAVKFTRDTPDASIEVRGGPAPAKPGMVVIEVRDNGLGFHASQNEAVFKPFKQVHPDQSGEGAGLGLAIVQRIIERHGGQIEAHGEEGAGAVFRFTLPPA